MEETSLAKFEQMASSIVSSRKSHMPVFGTASSIADMDEDGSPTIQQTRVGNPSSGEGFIPRAMGRNKARRLKEKGKANDDYAAQHEVAASLRLLVEQNALEAEERKCRHEEPNKYKKRWIIRIWKGTFRITLQ
ncbi:hypothetical protein D8674_028350 [Pyrus ussuriensis x Pyrus communis]|uniref:Uncharacterized protein n=1 Tax=Pyrus ussuriensis x Pyrus communis TaxID=2448454 RepID=A0A5N5HZ13_9ROSA|nr:hypothetical protein D8674_028350 [Pyrus ussuriensis x Pyrus communis]